MKSKSIPRLFVLAAVFALVSSPTFAIAQAADVRLPVIRGEKIVATVNDEPITLEQYGKQLALTHEGATEKDQVSKMDPAGLLERMIKLRLVVQEAENMGLDRLPEVEQAMEFYRQESMRNLLFGEQVRAIKKADPKETERIYRNLVKETKVSSVRFDKKEDADSFRSAIQAAGDFRALAARAEEEGKAKASDKGVFIKPSQLPPEMAVTLSKMKTGEVSPVIKVGKKFTVLKVEAIRHPDDKEKRKEAAKQALQQKRSEALRKFVGSLEKKYVKYDRNLIKTIDFEAESPGFEALLKDERPVAWIQGENPVTVKDWAEALKKMFFHGVEQPITQKRVNVKKDLVLDQVVRKRVVLKEAKRRKIDRSPAFREMAREARDELLFGAFVQKVVHPESRGTDEELKAYMQEHIAEFTVPETIRLGILIFTRKEDAEEAIGKLRAGADFQWMLANATGQADPSAVKPILDLNGKLVSKSELPEKLQQAVAGATAADYRLHAGSDGRFYVIAIEEVVPPRPEEFEIAKDRVVDRVFREKREKLLEGWMEKLRNASHVKVHAKGDQLRRLMEMQVR